MPPPQTSGGFGGSLALHGLWSGCTTWGAGIGADINTPLLPDGSSYIGPKVPYDLSTYSGMTFLAMAAPGSDTRFRFKLPTRATTRIQDGGTCDEAVAGDNTCGDDWGQPFTLTSNGSWSRILVKFSDPRFRQEGWGLGVRWDPRDVTGIQIQSGDAGEVYDFWIDDIYLVK